MQRCQTFAVLSIEIAAPRDDVIESELSPGEGSPVQRGALTVVFGVDPQPFVNEVS